MFLVGFVSGFITAFVTSVILSIVIMMLVSFEPRCAKKYTNHLIYSSTSGGNIRRG